MSEDAVSVMFVSAVDESVHVISACCCDFVCFNLEVRGAGTGV